jgi:hypothetical protein
VPPEAAYFRMRSLECLSVDVATGAHTSLIVAAGRRAPLRWLVLQPFVLHRQAPCSAPTPLASRRKKIRTGLDRLWGTSKGSKGTSRGQVLTATEAMADSAYLQVPARSNRIAARSFKPTKRFFFAGNAALVRRCGVSLRSWRPGTKGVPDARPSLVEQAFPCGHSWAGTFVCETALPPL